MALLFTYKVLCLLSIVAPTLQYRTSTKKSVKIWKLQVPPLLGNGTIGRVNKYNGLYCANRISKPVYS